jgi:hypothetical protein
MYGRYSTINLNLWISNNLKNFNRLMNPYSNENEIMKETEFRKVISGVSNDPLPANNKALFECLVGQQPIRGEDGLKYPVSFSKS